MQTWIIPGKIDYYGPTKDLVGYLHKNFEEHSPKGLAYRAKKVENTFYRKKSRLYLTTQSEQIELLFNLYTYTLYSFDGVYETETRQTEAFGLQ